MAADIRTFWGTLLSVLLKCITALGFTAPARTANRTQGTTAPVADRAKAPVGAAVAAGPGDLRASDAPPASPAATRRAGVRIPAPRTCTHLPPVALPSRRKHALTLPPTMKQRISAEAHGSSPSARSRRTDTAAQTEDESTSCA